MRTSFQRTFHLGTALADTRWGHSGDTRVRGNVNGRALPHSHVMWGVCVCVYNMLVDENFCVA
jgi:hypothetical protein